MSQMPDKIWLHKDTKYSTGDIVSAYQYECAQEIETEGIENFVEYINKNLVNDMLKTAEDHAYFAGSEAMREKLIEKACEWLNNFYSEDRHCYLVAEDIEAFKKAMEEEENERI